MSVFTKTFAQNPFVLYLMYGGAFCMRIEEEIPTLAIINIIYNLEYKTCTFMQCRSNYSDRVPANSKAQQRLLLSDKNKSGEAHLFITNILQFMHSSLHLIEAEI